MEGNEKQASVTLRYESWKVPMVKSGACRQTIRREVKAKIGDVLLHAYKTSGKSFRTDVCTATRHALFLDKSRLVIDGEHVSLNTRYALARADGFRNAFELAAFIGRTYGFPFYGTVIQW